MILTYKIKHNRDFSEELRKAKLVAEHALTTKSITSSSVKDIGLKSVISNQILRKYSRNKKIRKIHNVNLVIPSQGIQYDRNAQQIYIPCLKLRINYLFPNNFVKINQIEVNNEYLFVSVSKTELPTIDTQSFAGIDLNATGHVAVMANVLTGKVKKLGKQCAHVHKKYSNIRKGLQRLGKFRKLKKIKNRESRIVRDINHKISRTIVNEARRSNGVIVMENLKDIRQNKKYRKSFNYTLHSWSFYQLKRFIEYKAKLLGIPIMFVSPYNTSKTCSRCGLIGDRNGKTFKCQCGHVDHADANAAFNIAQIAQACSIANDKGILARGSPITPKKLCAI